MLMMMMNTYDLYLDENLELQERMKGRLPFFFGQGKTGASEERLQRGGDI